MALASGTTTLTLVRNGDTIFIGEQSQDTTRAFIETKDLDFGDPVIKKYLRRILLWMTALDKLNSTVLIIKGRNFIDQPHEILATIPLQRIVTPQPILKETVPEPISMRLPRRNLIRIRIEDNAVETPWALYGMEFWGLFSKGRF